MLVTRKSKRKPTGGLRHSLKRRNKVLTQLANRPTLTTIASAEDTRKIVRGKGAIKKVRAVALKFANVLIDGKIVKVEIKTVKLNPANREYARRNVITKGALINVEIKGQAHLAKVTSRPGQHGIINAVLAKASDVQEKEPKEKKAKKVQEKKVKPKLTKAEKTTRKSN